MKRPECFDFALDYRRKKMTCKKCGTENAPLKKCCSSCGAFLEGRAINNVTGEVGYRNADGSFTQDRAKSPNELINKTRRMRVLVQNHNL